MLAAFMSGDGVHSGDLTDARPARTGRASGRVGSSAAASYLAASSRCTRELIRQTKPTASPAGALTPRLLCERRLWRGSQSLTSACRA
jgi:hypothetical protein